MKENPSFLRLRFVDLVIRIALGLFFAFAAGVYFHNAIAPLYSISFDQLDLHTGAQVLSIFTNSLFTLMLALLYALRLRAKSTAGLWPSIAALLGGFMLFGLLLLKPRTDLSLSTQIIACLLVMIGNGMAIYALVHLGRSFSILPESRRLVTSGPYQTVRHPLYVAEAIASCGVVITFLSVSAVLLLVAQTIFQIVRIHYEEKILTGSFPEYADYAKKTWRLVPGIY